jgi:hypothetical protein
MIVRIVAIIIAAVGVYYALQWFWPSAGQPAQSKSASNIIPLTLPPNAKSSDAKPRPDDEAPHKAQPRSE